MKPISVGVLTVSDRCSKGTRKDGSGPALKSAVRRRGWKVVESKTVPDDESAIAEILLEWADGLGLSLILTTGGTGLGPRDVTPEATRRVVEKELPGLPELMRMRGLRSTERAALSRAVAGARGRTLILNLPGHPDAARDCLAAVAKVIPHALEILGGANHDGNGHAHR